MEGLTRLGRGGLVAPPDVVAGTASGASAGFGAFAVVVALALVDVAVPAFVAVALLGLVVLVAVEPATLVTLVALARVVVALVAVLVTAPPCFPAGLAGARRGAGAFFAAALVVRVAGGRDVRPLGALARGSSVDIRVRPSDGCTASVRPEATASVCSGSSLVDRRPRTPGS